MSFPRNQPIAGLTFLLVRADSFEPVTDGQVAGYIAQNGQGQSPLQNAPYHLGNGQWAVDLQPEETDADALGLLFCCEGAVPVAMTIFPDALGPCLADMIEQPDDQGWRLKPGALAGVFQVGLADVEQNAPDDSLCTLCLAGLHSQVDGSTWTIRKTDGTPKIIKTIVTAAGAEPIVAVE